MGALFSWLAEARMVVLVRAGPDRGSVLTLTSSPSDAGSIEMTNGFCARVGAKDGVLVCEIGPSVVAGVGRCSVTCCVVDGVFMVAGAGLCFLARCVIGDTPVVATVNLLFLACCVERGTSESELESSVAVDTAV